MLQKACCFGIRSYAAESAVHVVLQMLTRNIMTKLVALILLGVPFIAIGGFLYKRAAKGTTWKEALFKSYAVSQNIPGEQAKAFNDCFALLTLVHHSAGSVMLQQSQRI